MRDVALNYLNRDKIKHIGMLECVKYDDVEYLYAKDDGVFIYDKRANLYMLATDNELAAREAIARRDNCRLIVCHNFHDYELARERYELFGLNKCHQVLWEGTDPLPLRGVCEIKKLEPDDETVDFVFSHYTLAFDKNHLRYIIENLGMYGAYCGGKLVGYIGRHEERSLGLLEVLPEYRRLGIATELESYLMNKLIQNGEVPYGHIIYGNDKSFAMHVKMGYTFCPTPVYWIFKKK